MFSAKLNPSGFFITVQHDVSEVPNLILKWSKLTGGMNITPVKLKVADDLTFIKRRITPFGLCETVRQVIQNKKELISSLNCQTGSRLL